MCPQRERRGTHTCNNNRGVENEKLVNNLRAKIVKKKQQHREISTLCEHRKYVAPI